MKYIHYAATIIGAGVFEDDDIFEIFNSKEEAEEFCSEYPEYNTRIDTFEADEPYKEWWED